MIHMIAAWILLGISHLLSLWALTEPKYSVRKTLFIYSIFCAGFVFFITLSYDLFGED